MRASTIETDHIRRNTGYRSSSVNERSGLPKQGHAGYKSHAIGAESGHPREGSNAGYRSHNESGIVVREHTIFDGSSVRRYRSLEWPTKPEYDIVSVGTLVALQTASTILPGATLPAAALVGYDFPPNPWLGAAEATALAAGAAASFIVNKKFARSVV